MKFDAGTIKSWIPPNHLTRIQTIDAHTAGEPLRIIIGGFPEFEGHSILEQRRFIAEHHDQIRRTLMWEPRGHADMYGCLITAPVSPEADFGVIFTHNDGYSTMCGHGIIAVTKVVLETGFIKKQEPTTIVKIDSPAGLITAEAHILHDKITSISFENVPSFVLIRDAEVEVPNYGPVIVDVAFGGAFYAFVEAATLSLECTPQYSSQLIDMGMNIKNAVSKRYDIKHPTQPDLSYLYGTIFIAPPKNKAFHSRNVCIFAEGEVDRSPTGTGVSARMALHYRRGEVSLNQEITIESIIDTTFTGAVLRETKCGKFDAIIPRVAGSAYITGQHEFIIDPNDPLKDGFLIR
jgi:trans-L-3-hydroxyproline dehydratase